MNNIDFWFEGDYNSESRAKRLAKKLIKNTIIFGIGLPLLAGYITL